MTFLAKWGLPVIHMPLTAVCQLPVFTNYPWSARGCRLPEVCQLSAVCGTLIPGVVTSHSGESVPSAFRLYSVPLYFFALAPFD